MGRGEERGGVHIAEMLRRCEAGSNGSVGQDKVEVGESGKSQKREAVGSKSPRRSK